MARSKVTFVVDAEDAKAIQSFQRLENKEEALARKSEEISKKQEAMNQRTQRGNQNIASSVDKIADRYLSLAGVVASAGAAMRGVTEQFEKNMRAADQANASLSRLGALGTLRPEEIEGYLGQSGKLMPEQVGRIGFTLKSSGLSRRDIGQIFEQTNMAMTMGENPEMFAQSLGSMKRSVFSGKSISQIDSFLGEMSKRSPLSADAYAQEFLKIGGLAGITDSEKAAGGALMSGIMSAMGADSSPELASTAAKGFLVKRQGAGGDYLKSIGLGGMSVPQQISGLSNLAMSGQLDERGFLDAFGERTAPALLALMRSPNMVRQLGADTMAGTAALSSTGPSYHESLWNQKMVLAPNAQGREMLEIQRARNERARFRRGMDDSEIQFQAERVRGEMESGYVTSAFGGALDAVGLGDAFRYSAVGAANLIRGNADQPVEVTVQPRGGPAARLRQGE